MHITFTDYDDLELAHNTGVHVSLARFRAMFKEGAPDTEDCAPVRFYAKDGNDYAVVETSGESFTLIGIDNTTHREGVESDESTLLMFDTYPTFYEALTELIITSDTDLNGE